MLAISEQNNSALKPTNSIINQAVESVGFGIMQTWGKLLSYLAPLHGIFIQT